MTCLPSAARQSGANALPASLILTQIRDLIYRVAGIFQADSKLGLLQERCQKRMQVLGIASLRDYYECLTVKPMRQAELVSLLNVITVGKTCFFRNRAQLDAVQKIALPRIIEAKSKLCLQQLRIWSAGCSTGEEPYTLAMILLEEFQAQIQGWTVEILGTDLNERFIAYAKAGSYGEPSIRNLDAHFRGKYFNADLPRHDLFRKLEFAAHEPLPRTPDVFQLPPSQQSLPQGNTYKAPQGMPEIVVLGTSTGGPQALQDILPQLPADLPVAMLVVQHMPPGFTAPMAERLDCLSKVKVRKAQQGDVLQPGIVYIAPAGRHATIMHKLGSEATIHLSDYPSGTAHRPSVDVTMLSVAEVFGRHAVGIILTGMGTDGLQGMTAIRNAGGITIGQDEATSVVYGMPRHCAESGVLQKVVPLSRVPWQILQAVRYPRQDRSSSPPKEPRPAKHTVFSPLMTLRSKVWSESELCVPDQMALRRLTQRNRIQERFSVQAKCGSDPAKDQRRFRPTGPRRKAAGRSAAYRGRRILWRLRRFRPIVRDSPLRTRVRRLHRERNAHPRLQELFDNLDRTSAQQAECALVSKGIP
jgi:chemotaxis response regulator CheB